jgi:hypothetical protein
MVGKSSSDLFGESHLSIFEEGPEKTTITVTKMISHCLGEVESHPLKQKQVKKKELNDV